MKEIVGYILFVFQQYYEFLHKHFLYLWILEANVKLD